MAGRKPDPERKSELLDAVIDYLFEHGLSDLSLRPLSDALETSPRNLLYHFGSKEEMVVQALTEARDREQRLVLDWMRTHPDAALEEILQHFWMSLSSAENAPFLRLLFEVYAIALYDPTRFPGFPEAAVADWFPVLEQAFLSHGLGASEAQMRATLTVATARGLLLDLLAIGDRERVDRAFGDLAARVSQGPRRRERWPWHRE